MKLVDSIVEINNEKYVLWFFEDEYKLYSCIHATPVEDWEKLQDEFGDDDMEYYCQFSSIFIYNYDELKENIEALE